MEMNSLFRAEFEQRKNEAESGLMEFLPKCDSDAEVISEAMNYSLLAGGKRLRPVIMLETYRLFGGKNEKIVQPFAAALEMIHTYSLIHDDLPAMDNDDLRRGRATNHKVYGEAIAILAGDGLLNLAAETALRAFDRTEDCEEYKKISSAAKELFFYSGINGMIGGQVLDMLSEDEKAHKDEQFFRKIYSMKTGGLITAAFVIGALLAGADADRLDEIRETGNSFGIVFQLQDDLLDMSGDEKALGKPVHSDDRNNKFTYLKLIGENRAKEMIEENSAAIIKELEKATKADGSYDGFLVRLTEYIKNRDR